MGGQRGDRGGVLEFGGKVMEKMYSDSNLGVWGLGQFQSLKVIKAIASQVLVGYKYWSLAALALGLGFTDEDITLVNDDADKEMFDVDALNGEEVFVAGQNENVIEKIVDAAQVRKSLSHDKGKGILVEPKKPLKKKDQLKLDEEIALKLQVEIDEEERIARAEEEKINEASIAWDDIQAKVNADYELAERVQAKEQE
ncbi:hypothetical protein Tco_1554388 [Tanacetum coccineum]